MTLDVYSGLFDDDFDGVAERLNQALPAEWYPSGTREPRTEVIEPLGRQNVEPPWGIEPKTLRITSESSR
jgi:hypothetical protein